MGNELANIEKQLAEEARTIQETLASTGTVISTKGKLFTTPNGLTNPGPISVIILDYVSYNSYFPKTFNPQDIRPPICYSIGKIPKDMVPMDDSPEPQSTSCAECEWDKFGTSRSGTGKGKACKNVVRLAVVPPDFSPKDEPMLLVVPPTSLANFNTYVSKVAQTFNGPPIRVKTSITFDQDQSYPVLIFGNPEPHNRLSDAMAIRAKASNLLMKRPSFD